MAELLNKIPTNLTEYPNSFKRQGAFPLEAYSVFYTMDAAEAYASSNPIAYVGQTLAVVTANAENASVVDNVTFYIIADANGTLQEVGKATNGDGNSITLEDGVLSLAGFEAAGSATLPQKSPVFKKDAEGNDTDEIDHYELKWVSIDAIVEGDGNTKTILETAEDSVITISPYYDSDLDMWTYTLDATIPEAPEYSITKEETDDGVKYQLTKDNVAVGETIDVHKAYDDTELSGRVTTVEQTVADHESWISSIESEVNTFFGAVEDADEIINTLAEIQKHITDDETGAASMLDSIGANTTALETLKGSGEGSISKAISDAIGAQAAVDAAAYALKEDLADVKSTADAAAAKTYVDDELAKKVDSTTLTSTLSDYYQKSETYSKEAIDAKLDGITGAYGETADKVAGDLRAHIQDNAASFAAIETKQGEQDAAIQANAKALTDALAEINDGQNGILAQAATAAQEKINALANGQVTTNTQNISSLNSTVEGLTAAVTGDGGLSSRVGAVEGKTTTLESNLAVEVGQREALGETVNTHSTDIAGLKTTTSEHSQSIAANTAKFADYSTTDQVATKIATEIAANNVTINASIAEVTTAVTDEATRAKAREDEIAALVTANDTAIKKNTQDIASINSTLAAALENNGEGLDSIKELALWVEEHETDVLPVVNKNKADIEALSGEIEVLNGEANIPGSVKNIVNIAIAGIPTATAERAGLVKASEEITVDDNGVLGIGVVSTDKLVNGTDTLVLSGGKA